MFTNNILAALIKATPITPTNGVITFSFTGGLSQLSAATQEHVRYALKMMIEPFINVKFQETIGQGDMTFQLTDEPGVYAFAQGRNIFFSRSNDNALSDSGFQRGFGSHGFMTIVHETLHAMGLDHPGNYNGEGGTDGPFLPYAMDNTTNSIMSYNFAGKGAITPMAYDIAALQYLYGASNQNSGNTTYQFTSVSSFNDGFRNWGNSALSSKLTLVDQGGYDTLDFSRLGFNAGGYRLDARSGGIITTRNAYNTDTYNPKDFANPNRDFFDIDKDGDKLEVRSIQFATSPFGTTLGLGSTVERIFGSHSGDTIFGGAANNVIHANHGNDLVFGDNNSNALQNNPSGNDHLFGGAGHDHLRGEAGNDVLYGQLHNDVLVGGQGNDVLIGSNTLVTADRDQLFGGTERDWFVLGNQQGSFYQGSGFAIIKDWQPGIDKIQLGSTNGSYSLSSVNITGGASLDTGIYHNGDLIGVVEDTTNVSSTRGDFMFA